MRALFLGDSSLALVTFSPISVYSVGIGSDSVGSDPISVDIGRSRSDIELSFVRFRSFELRSLNLHGRRDRLVYHDC